MLRRLNKEICGPKYLLSICMMSQIVSGAVAGVKQPVQGEMSPFWKSRSLPALLRSPPPNLIDGIGDPMAQESGPQCPEHMYRPMPSRRVNACKSKSRSIPPDGGNLQLSSILFVNSTYDKPAFNDSNAVNHRSYRHWVLDLLPGPHEWMVIPNGNPYRLFGSFPTPDQGMVGARACPNCGCNSFLGEFLLHVAASATFQLNDNSRYPTIDDRPQF